MPRAVQGSGGPLTAEFEVGFLGTDGVEARAPLVNSTEVRFEQVKPVRTFSSYKRQRPFQGCGGRRRPVGMPATSPGWSATI